MRLMKIKDVVLDVLEKSPRTRDNDMHLYVEVCERFNHGVALEPFHRVFLNYNELGIPNFESVGRARRKIQEQRPDLQSSEEAKIDKAEKEAEFIAFSRA